MLCQNLGYKNTTFQKILFLNLRMYRTSRPRFIDNKIINYVTVQNYLFFSQNSFYNIRAVVALPGSLLFKIKLLRTIICSKTRGRSKGWGGGGQSSVRQHTATDLQISTDIAIKIRKLDEAFPISGDEQPN